MTWYELFYPCLSGHQASLSGSEMILPERVRKICFEERALDEQQVGAACQTFDARNIVSVVPHINDIGDLLPGNRLHDVS